MFHKKEKFKSYDKSIQKPILHVSICTGEQVAGFRNLETGKFEEIMFVRDKKDLENFLKQYHISQSEIEKEW